MIVTLHAATGALAGRATRSRIGAVVLGLLSHIAGDALPHRDIRSRRFETLSGIAAVLFLASRFGPLEPATVGAAAAAVPDLEHILPLPRPGGRPLFPSHRYPRLHHGGGIPAWAQLVVAALLLAALARRPRLCVTDSATALTPLQRTLLRLWCAEGAARASASACRRRSSLSSRSVSA